MIVSVNPKPSFDEFSLLMHATDALLNDDALKRPQYYTGRSGNPLEDDVKAALDEAARGTPFENTIEKVSGQKFPDIVASKFYGIEVKSTKNNHWTSTGSSILESSRIADVERIFMTFGKLGGNPIQFVSKPYEECLSGIAVTHMPRYLIDMRLKDGETIFDKIGVPYDELRLMDNPVAPVSKYYKSKLKKGESLWWLGDPANEAVSMTVRLWKTVISSEKRIYTAYALVNYPEVFCGDYDRYALWLTSQGIVDTHIRDQFSAGGQVQMQMPNGSSLLLPGVYKRVKENIGLIIRRMGQQDITVFDEPLTLDADIIKRRIIDWVNSVSLHSNADYKASMYALYVMLLDAGIDCFGGSIQ